MKCYVTFLFFDVPAVKNFVSNSEFDVEFVDKKNCIFSFFHTFKSCIASKNTADCHLWPDKPVLFNYTIFLCQTHNSI